MYFSASLLEGLPFLSFENTLDVLASGPEERGVIGSRITQGELESIRNKAHLQMVCCYFQHLKPTASSSVKDGISLHVDHGMMLTRLLNIKLLGVELYRKKGENMLSVISGTFI